MLTTPRGFDRERTNVHKLQYHFIWCPKYRKSVLEGEVATVSKNSSRREPTNSG
jgi:REP element-mobilizing transposase RayT